VNARHRLLCAICCVTAASLVSAGGPEKPAAAPLVVYACLPVERQIAPYEDFTGRIDAAASVELKARVTGYLERVLFKDGAEVKQGETLFEIDPRPYQVQFAKAEADLRASEARLRSAKVDFDRVSALAAKGAIGREEVDKTASARDVADANVQIARAALDSARITLGYAKVFAPIDGRIGRRLLDAGNLVKADETTLAHIVNTTSMSAHFEIDEGTFLRLRHASKDGKINESAAIGLADETGFPRKAKLDFVDSRVDPARGTIAARAVLLDADKQLRPGMFCRIRLTTSEPRPELLVPERAIGLAQAQTLLVVNAKNMLEIRPVELGRSQDGGMRIVTRGLKAGERVMLDASRQLTLDAPVDTVEMVDSTWRPKSDAKSKNP
jgi:RND family efflux transporter MFP subunit